VGSNDDLDPAWVATLARRLDDEGDVLRWWDLSTDLLLSVPGLAGAAQQVRDRRDRARRLLAELRQFTGSVALHSVDAAILGLPATGSGEFAEGYQRGLRACRMELSHHLERPPVPRPDTVEILGQLSDRVPTPPATDAVRESFHAVLARQATPPRRAEELGGYVVRFVAASLDEAGKELDTAHRAGRRLVEALRAPGDLHVTESVVSRTLTDRLRSFAAAVRRDATPGRGFGAGFYVASEHVARMSEMRASDLRFSRGQG
jgi:hypothetical protein